MLTTQHNDPDSFIRAHGVAAYRAQLEGAQPWLRFLVEQSRVTCDLDHPVDRATAYLEIMRAVNQIKKSTLREKCEAIARREVLGLSDRRGTLTTQATSTLGLERADPIISTARLNVIFGTLLAHGLRLDDRDYEALLSRPGWSEDRLFGAHEFQHPQSSTIKLRPAKVSSAPETWLALLSVCEWLASMFDLAGVPGFYREDDVRQPAAGARDDEWQLYEWKEMFGPWRVKLHDKFNRVYRNAVVAPYEHEGMIVGLQIYPNVAGKVNHRPFLLSSRGLPCGSQAVAA